MCQLGALPVVEMGGIIISLYLCEREASTCVFSHLFSHLFGYFENFSLIQLNRNPMAARWTFYIDYGHEL